MDSNNIVTSVYRFIVDEERETVTDERWTLNGWAPSGDAVVKYLISGTGDLEEVSEEDIKKYSPEILEFSDVSEDSP
jgi:hypothetical protein